MADGFALIECHEGRRAGEKRAIDRWIARLRRADRIKGWPKRAKLGIVEEITRLYGEQHGVRANARVVVQAPTKRGLLDIFDFFEKNFSHVEGYGF